MRREVLFENIRRGYLKFPQNINKDALDLIVKLMQKNPAQRLGAGPTDAEEIKQHPFFRGLNWDDVLRRKLRPPKPVFRPIMHTGINFSQYTEAEDETDDRIHHWSFVASDFV